MIRKMTLALVLAFGLAIPACGGGNPQEDFCNDLVNGLLDKCDPDIEADAAMLAGFLEALGEDLTFEEVVANNGAAAKEACSSGYSDEEWSDADKAQADAFIDALNETQSCGAALQLAQDLLAE